MNNFSETFNSLTTDITRNKRIEKSPQGEPFIFEGMVYTIHEDEKAVA